MLLEVQKLVPEPGQPLTRHGLREWQPTGQRGAVTALGSACGLLVVATAQKDGSKVYLYQFQNQEALAVCAFCDVQLYTVALRTLRSFIVVGDLSQSVTVLRVIEDKPIVPAPGSGGVAAAGGVSLVRVSRERARLDVTAVDFFVHGAALGFTACDARGNFIVYGVDPTSRETAGGRALTPLIGVRLASPAVALARTPCTPLALAPARYAAPIWCCQEGGRGHSVASTHPCTSVSAASGGAEGSAGAASTALRHALLYGSLDGGRGRVLPVPEDVYRRLQMVQSRLVVVQPHRAGLHPRALRAVARPGGAAAPAPVHGVLDGDLLWTFPALALPTQHEVADRVGTTVARVWDDLLYLARLAPGL